MWHRSARRQTPERLPFGVEYVPGLGALSRLSEAARWRLAGEYATTHRLVGPWYRRAYAVCGTRGSCEFGRWVGDVLASKVRQEWCGWVAMPTHSPFSPERPPPGRAPVGCPGCHRVGAGSGAVAGAPARSARRYLHMRCVRPGDALSVLAVRGRVPGRRLRTVAPRGRRGSSGRGRSHTRVAARERALAPGVGREPISQRRRGTTMVYALGVADVQRRIDSLDDCGHCGGGIVWDEVHGWLHLDGWYACRTPASGRPHEVMAAPAVARP